MGPRQKCLGNASNAVRLYYLLRLQWGRDKNVSEIYGIDSNKAITLLCFNGAETKMSRKFIRSVAIILQSTLLQWGRDKNVSEIQFSSVGAIQERSFNGAETKMSRKSYGYHV